LNIAIDQKWLLNGSIVPDIHPFMMFIPHTKDKSLRIVQKNMDWLIERGIPNNKKDIEKFSYKLGIIIHFVSDYFCKAHNERKYDNLLIHYLYERKLKEYCTKHIKGSKPLKQVSKIKDWQLQGSIMEFIDEKHAEYNSLERGISDDMAYSLGVSTEVALCIVSYSIRNENSNLTNAVNIVRNSA
jgi:hypothetical protein